MRDESVLLVPGATFAMGFQIVMSDGETQNTKGFAGGKVKWDNFQIIIKGGTFNEGYITISNVPEEVASHKIHVSVLALSSNSFSKEFVVDLSYVTNIELTYEASAGLSPGSHVPLTVRAKLNDGTTLSTNSQGSLNWNSLIV